MISAPVPLSPPNGGMTDARPVLTVADATRSGPVGAVIYRFEIADNAVFAPILITATVPEKPAQTWFALMTDLVPNKTYFWQVTAVDQTNSFASQPSAARSFTTSQAIDLRTVVVAYADAPSEVASWAETATIDLVEQDGGGEGLMCIKFSLSDTWPFVPFFGDPTVPVYANQWYFANIGGQWYGGPGEHLRADRPGVTCKSGQGTRSIGPDGGWKPPMSSWVPKAGELVG
jgi:hypothetical protein